VEEDDDRIEQSGTYGMNKRRMTLDEIMRDSLHSTYIDDTYYAMLRNDLVDWRQAGVALDPSERSEYETVVLQENWLLDQRDFEKWYGLFSNKCLYWIPANMDMPDPVSGNPQDRVTIALDDRRRMADRIAWLRTGIASSQLPVSRTTHASTGFVRVPTSQPGEVKVRSTFVMHEMRAQHAVQTLTGWMGHVFIKEDGETKIDRKLICLLDASRGRHNPTFIV
jgi:3-phenylpropionate/cinnamic acid dioxygenase small subunit